MPVKDEYSSFAECALYDDQNQFLTQLNNKAKVCRSTKSVVLGKGNVMVYEEVTSKACGERGYTVNGSSNVVGGGKVL